MNIKGYIVGKLRRSVVFSRTYVFIRSRLGLKYAVKKFRTVVYDNIPDEAVSVTEVIVPETVLTYSPVYHNAARTSSDTAGKEAYLQGVRMYEFNNGTVIGGSNVILLESGAAFYNHTVAPDVNYTDQAFTDYRVRYRLRRHNRIYFRRGEAKVLDKACTFCCNYSSNYYHFVFECLSKFFALAHSEIDADIPLVVDDSVRMIPQFSELVKLFNTEGRDIVYVMERELIKARVLYAFSPVNYIPANYVDYRNIDSSSFRFRPGCLDFLRGCVEAGSLSMSGNHEEKIFISRRNNSNRAYNNDEIEECLSEAGFGILHPELMSFREQAAAFYGARLIVGATGAALTNIIFCRPGTKVVVLSGAEFDISIFSTVSRYLGLEMQYIASEGGDGKERLHSGFRVDPEMLINVIGKI